MIAHFSGKTFLNTTEYFDPVHGEWANAVPNLNAAIPVVIRPDEVEVEDISATNLEGETNGTAPADPEEETNGNATHENSKDDEANGDEEESPAKVPEKESEESKPEAEESKPETEESESSKRRSTCTD